MTIAGHKLYHSKQIRQLERDSREQAGISEATMMARAGEGAFKKLLDVFAAAQKIAVFCGAGNNGGDGYVVARLAQEAGLQVEVWQCGDCSRYADAASEALNDCRHAGVPLQPFSQSAPIQADVIVDALLGIGLTGEVRSPYTDVIAQINQSGIPVLSLDVPSGINADTGSVCGVAVKADVTVTFIGYKQGLVTGAAKQYCGELFCDDLALPETAFARVAHTIAVSDYVELAKCLPPRSRDSHKGNNGHVLVIGGDYGYAGAVAMAGIAALRTGAGLVSVASRPEHASCITALCPALMVHGVNDGHALKLLLEKASSVVLGPGLGHSAWSVELFTETLRCHKPLLIDADGLNLLAKHPTKIPDSILTPHPGEAARLLGVSTQDVQSDRFAALSRLRTQYSDCVLLKGAGTLISGPNGTTSVCPYGNPGMATGGTGDILSGIIGGLRAQNLDKYHSADLGVCIHGLSGDRAAQAGERGMIAPDLLSFIQPLVNPKSI